MNDKVTLVITSSNRPELLKRTIYSFMKFNSYPIEKYIIIDDSAINSFHKELESEFGAMFEIIANPVRIGQIASIDKAYSRVTTPYIFHCEDDWEFYRFAFIELSLALLNDDAKILQVWLRERNDTNGHPVEPLSYCRAGVPYQRLAYDFQGYNGFSFNPGLKRVSDYDLIKPYSSVKYDATHPAKRSKFYAPESEISQFYKDLGYRAVIPPYGFVKHIGWQARVGWD